MKNLLSPAVNRSDLRSISYNKTIFGRDSARTWLGELMTLSQTPESNEEGNTSSPFSSPFASDPRAYRSLSESAPHFGPKLRPAAPDCNAVLSGLQRVLTAAARIVCGIRPRNHVTDQAPLVTSCGAYRIQALSVGVQCAKRSCTVVKM